MRRRAFARPRRSRTSRCAASRASSHSRRSTSPLPSWSKRVPQPRGIALPFGQQCGDFGALLVRLDCIRARGAEGSDRIQHRTGEQQPFGHFAIALVPGLAVARKDFGACGQHDAGTAVVDDPERQFTAPVVDRDPPVTAVALAYPPRVPATRRLAKTAGGPRLGQRLAAPEQLDVALRSRCDARGRQIAHLAVAAIVGRPGDCADRSDQQQRPWPHGRAVGLSGADEDEQLCGAAQPRRAVQTGSRDLAGPAYGHGSGAEQ
jgi:hypothetical protein